MASRHLFTQFYLIHENKPTKDILRGNALIAASYGVPSCFFAGGDIACTRASRAVPEIITVVTKHEISRNEAVFRNDEDLFADIKAKVSEAVLKDIPTHLLTYPAVMEKSFKRVEDAAEYLAKLLEDGIEAEYISDEILGKDAHTVRAAVYDIDNFIRCI